MSCGKPIRIFLQTLNSRTGDNWRPLLALADIAGGDWPAKARAAFNVLAEDDQDSDAAGVMLLKDIKAMFEKRSADQLPSQNMVDALIQVEESPWPEYRRGKPITPRQMSALLSLSG